MKQIQIQKNNSYCVKIGIMNSRQTSMFNKSKTNTKRIVFNLKATKAAKNLARMKKLQYRVVRVEYLAILKLAGPFVK